MKVYIFLTPSITGIGGAELYVSKKCNHLRGIGYKVLVFSYCKGIVKIPTLVQYNNLIIPELEISYLRASKKIRELVDRYIDDFIDKEDEFVVESNLHELSLWGEYLARKTNGTHLCYPLSETFPKIHDSEKEFYRFKYKQKLLYGIMEESIKTMINDGKDYANSRLEAVNSTGDSLDFENEYTTTDFPQCDYNILSFGRLNKEYIPYMLDAVKKFAQKNTNNSIGLTMVGGFETDSVVKRIEKCGQEASNLQILRVGEVYPVPSNLICRNDVAIATAGCATICCQYGVPTITIDADDFKAIGILGLTTIHHTKRVDEPKVEIDELLKQIIVDKSIGSINRPNHSHPDLDYSAHDSILDIKSEDYYDIDLIKADIRSRIIRFAITILGYANYKSLRHFLSASLCTRKY